MRKVLALVFMMFCFFAASAQRSHQGIGLRLGEPTGFTYKKYLSKANAYEFLLGASGVNHHEAYYENSFRSRDKYDDFIYRSHDVKRAVYLQGRYLLHNDIWVEGLVGKWDWYWGAGAMLKIASVKYRYEDEDNGQDITSTESDIDFGPEGIIGMEYTFEDVPITVFGEASLMLELVDRLTLQPFAGLGVRYNF